MKYLTILVLLFPMFATAHTSDERYVDGYIVDLSTAPVAPWVGEKVGMSFVFRDPITGLATTSVVSATMSIDALMRPSSKVQEIVFTSEKFSVDNGGFVTSHVFPEEGTFDMHLSFVDADGKEHLAGFRKQVRMGVGDDHPAIRMPIFLGLILFVALCAFIAGRLYRKEA